MVAQHVAIKLQVLPHLALVFIFQQWFEPGQNPVAIQLGRGPQIVVSQRQISRLARLDSKGLSSFNPVTASLDCGVVLRRFSS